MPLKVKVILEGDNSLPELGGKTDEAELYALTVLPSGMGSGKPSVGIVSKLPGGNYIFTQTSLALFLTSAKAMEAKYGHPE